MSFRQEIECPSCKQKHWEELPLVSTMMERNKELEQAFRNIFKACVDIVPLNAEEKTP